MAHRILALTCLLCAALSLEAAAADPSVGIHIDVRKQLGPAPYMWRAGVFLNSLPVGYPKERFFADQRPGMVELSWDFYDVLLEAPTEEEFFARLPASNLTTWVRETAAAGGEPYIRLMPVPRWLWSGANGARRPPADWAGWERFVERIVAYYNNQLRIDARYIVWDEPDLAWEGTTEEFLRLYRHSAAGLLRANPKARLGGPGPAAFNASIKGGPPLLPAFVRYCANTPLPGLARRLPLDILVWHTFDAAPTTPGTYEIEVQAARKLLADNGYGQGVELNVGSWAALAQYPEVGSARDSHFLAAFVVSSVIAMTRAGVERHAFFTLFEDWRRNRSEFADDMGLTTRHFVAKAGYYANTLLSRLQGTQVEAQVSDPFVQVAAAREGSTLRILASNLTPPIRMLGAGALHRLVARGYSRDQIKRLAPDAKELLRDRGRLERLDAPPEVKAELLKLHEAAGISQQRLRAPLTLQLALEGLPPGRYKVREYRIDAGHANPHAKRDAIEERLARAAQEGRAAAREALARTWSPDEMAQIAKLQSSGGNVAAFARKLPPAKQKEFREAVELLNAPAIKVAQEVNAAAHVRASELPELQVSGKGAWRLELPPNGVVLIELERAG